MKRDEFERLALEHLDAVYRMALHLTRRQDLLELDMPDPDLSLYTPEPDNTEQSS